MQQSRVQISEVPVAEATTVDFCERLSVLKGKEEE